MLMRLSDLSTGESGGGGVSRLDAIRRLVAFTRTLPNLTKITAVSINLEDLVLLLETAEAADALTAEEAA